MDDNPRVFAAWDRAYLIEWDEGMHKELHPYIDGLVQDCNNSMELLQSCTKPSI